MCRGVRNQAVRANSAKSMVHPRSVGLAQWTRNGLAPGQAWRRGMDDVAII